MTEASRQADVAQKGIVELRHNGPFLGLIPELLATIAVALHKPRFRALPRTCSTRHARRDYASDSIADAALANGGDSEIAPVCDVRPPCAWACSHLFHLAFGAVMQLWTGRLQKRLRVAYDPRSEQEA